MKLKRILVVDDERNIAFTLAAILEGQGYTTEWYTDSHQALQAIRDQPPDLVVADVAMPGMTGIELAITLLQERLPTTVVLMSGNAVTSEILVQGEQRGYFFEVLAKPISPPEILERVRRILSD